MQQPWIRDCFHCSLFGSQTTKSNLWNMREQQDTTKQRRPPKTKRNVSLFTKNGKKKSTVLPVLTWDFGGLVRIVPVLTFSGLWRRARRFNRAPWPIDRNTPTFAVGVDAKNCRNHPPVVSLVGTVPMFALVQRCWPFGTSVSDGKT